MAGSGGTVSGKLDPSPAPKIAPVQYLPSSKKALTEASIPIEVTLQTLNARATA